ncbi:MAG TPA: aldo/keto reductase [Stellaceae bacterium]|nr:aldo/keto reductase [Stellaceae bacterium]
MITRPIPRTGEALPVIGLGTWQTFDVGAEAKARAPLGQVLRHLLDAGGRVIDSSPMYGRAEGVTGDLVEELRAREKTFLATKVWTTGPEQGIAQMRRSAELFRAEVIDLMQIHNLVDWRTHLATLRRLKEEGRIRYIGITHYTPSAFDALAQVIETEADIDFVQLCYSIATPAAEERLLPLAEARGVAVLVNRPFEEGALLRRARQRPLPGLAAELGCRNWAQFFLKYVLGHPAVTCVIPATANPEHMADNLAAGTGSLPDAALRHRMRALWEAA